MSDLLDVRSGTQTIGNAALTGLSGTAKTISYTGNPAFMIDGKLHTGASCSGGALETTDDTTGAAFKALNNGYACLFVFTWNADGTWHVSQGPIVKTADLTNNAAVLDFPSIPADACPFAYVPMKHANATAFTFATGNWDQTGLTVGTVVNCSRLPAQPVTAFA
ncbi:MAG: hypothetical protein M0Z99_33950 [Betaproteobacteria bacterium]|nr:hypothetical protein [Betaproteobacteria bacterium]